ncbi:MULTISPECIES: hypothetical protein [Stenotrophomonas]|uniref:hypothetical protein n=1 Tax=Stenotrophomonas TaxID=40323 RepID=UPI0007700603|nr:MULTISPECIES: hypothetical protein [Stenotrophomonas]AMJ56608.1 hypothetical protein AXG53_08065 [Stenotrophomonas sp. KCTC 12332]
MESSQYVVDRRLYSDDVVARAAHRYTGKHKVELRIEGDTIVASFESPSLPEDIDASFARDLLDERLRAQVRAETAGLQEELLKAALAQAQPPVTPDVQV